MTERNDYVPIDCGLYSRYELAILHRRKLRVHWRDAEGMDHVETMIPGDLQTRAGAEYMEGLSERHEPRSVRLDRIHRIEPLDGEPL